MQMDIHSGEATSNGGGDKHSAAANSAKMLPCDTVAFAFFGKPSVRDNYPVVLPAREIAIHNTWKGCDTRQTTNAKFDAALHIKQLLLLLFSLMYAK